MCDSKFPVLKSFKNSVYVCLSVCVHPVCVQASMEVRKVLDLLESHLQMAVRCGRRESSPAPLQSSKGFSLLSYFSNPPVLNSYSPK